jgi:hypothetical protein
VKGPAPSGWRVWTGRVLLALSVAVSGFFFVSRWAINAPGLGSRDAGLALSLSLANPLSVYASVALTFVCALLAAAAAFVRKAWRTFLGAAVVSALPVAYLALRG